MTPSPNPDDVGEVDAVAVVVGVNVAVAFELVDPAVDADVAVPADPVVLGGASAESEAVVGRPSPAPHAPTANPARRPSSPKPDDTLRELRACMADPF